MPREPIEIQKPTAAKPWPHVECVLRASKPEVARNPQGPYMVKDETLPVIACISGSATTDGMCRHFVKMNKTHLWCSCEKLGG